MTRRPGLLMLWVLAGICIPVSQAETTAQFDPWTQSVRYALEYEADLSSVVSSGTFRRVWIPVPAQTPNQRVLSQEVESSWPHRITEDSYGNRFIYLEPNGVATETHLTARYVVERSPAGETTAAARGSGDRDDPDRYLKPARRIPLDGVIAKIAAEQSRGIEADAAKARAFYDYVYDTMTYSKHGDGWGQGDAVWACTAQYGNCTDFHSLYIGMARSEGIPARFTIGFPIDPTQTRGTRQGYHCWAEVYHAGRGWVPFDASEAKKSERRDDYFGALPSDRVEFTLGRDLVLEPAQAGEPVNYFIYPYAEIDGTPIEKLPMVLRYERLPTELAARALPAR